MDVVPAALVKLHLHLVVESVHERPWLAALGLVSVVAGDVQAHGSWSTVGAQKEQISCVARWMGPLWGNRKNKLAV